MDKIVIADVKAVSNITAFESLKDSKYAYLEALGAKVAVQRVQLTHERLRYFLNEGDCVLEAEDEVVFIPSNSLEAANKIAEMASGVVIEEAVITGISEVVEPIVNDGNITNPEAAVEVETTVSQDGAINV